MKADYTQDFIRLISPADRDNRQMKADYTRLDISAPLRLDRDNRQMKADYTKQQDKTRGPATEITAK